MADWEIVVYTCVTGNRHFLREDQNTEGAEFVAFATGPSKVWNVAPPYDRFKDETRNSRMQKIMPHMFLQAKYSIYMDCNMALKVPARRAVDVFLAERDVAVAKHPDRNDVYDEADACAMFHKDNVGDLSEHRKDYLRRGIPRHTGLAECGIILRRHTDEVARWNERWWAEYCRYSRRDQISFPVAFPLEKINLVDPRIEPWDEVFDRPNSSRLARHRDQGHS